MGGKPEPGGGSRASRSCPFRLSRSLSVPRVSVFTSIKGVVMLAPSISLALRGFEELKGKRHWAKGIGQPGWVVG